MNVEGEGGYPAEENPVVTIGKFQEDPSSSRNYRVHYRVPSEGSCAGLFLEELSWVHV